MFQQLTYFGSGSDYVCCAEFVATTNINKGNVEPTPHVLIFAPHHSLHTSHHSPCLNALLLRITTPPPMSPMSSNNGFKKNA
jgi:hypothetical protein